MDVIEKLERDYRIELVLTLNALFYLLVGVAVVGFGFYARPIDQFIEMELATELLGGCIKGFLIGGGLLMANDLRA